MALWVPSVSRLMEDSIGSVALLTMGASVTTGGTAPTKGSWVELVASTAYDAYKVTIMTADYSSSGADTTACVDIGIGAGGSEVVLIANLLAGNSPAWNLGFKVWTFPLKVPAGSRLSARAAGMRTTTAMRVGIELDSCGGLPSHWYGSVVDTYGVSSVPTGASVTPGNGVEGSWVQITASTTADYRVIVPSMQCNEISIGNRITSIDIGMGAAASEQAFTKKFLWFSDPAEHIVGPVLGGYVENCVPSGVRLAVRASQQTTVDVLECALHCVR